MQKSAVAAICATFSLVSLIGPSLAGNSTDPAPAQSQSSASGDPDKVVCRNRTATGSRLSYVRDCHTQREWNEITRSAREYINLQQQKAMEAGRPGG